jgi:hypothetical protein
MEVRSQRELLEFAVFQELAPICYRLSKDFLDKSREDLPFSGSWDTIKVSNDGPPSLNGISMLLGGLFTNDRPVFLSNVIGLSAPGTRASLDKS